jgi:hypothetical protein
MIQALGWEKRSLSGSSPALHWQAPQHRHKSHSRSATKFNKQNSPIQLQIRASEIFFVSSFNLYASFALLVIARLTQSTAPFTTTRLPALVAGSPNLNRAHRTADF